MANRRFKKAESCVYYLYFLPSKYNTETKMFNSYFVILKYYFI